MEAVTLLKTVDLVQLLNQQFKSSRNYYGL